VNVIDPTVEVVVDDVVVVEVDAVEVVVVVVLVEAGAVYWKVMNPVAPLGSVATTT
jgi:hypothetical protein